MKSFISRFWFLYLAIALLWLKTYIIQKVSFDLPVESAYQEFILFINPISSVLFLIWLCFVLSTKRINGSIVFVSFMTSFVLFANLMYHRFFNDFITLPVLFQTSNMGDLSKSAFTLLKFSDILLFLDTIILFAIMMIKKAPRIVLQKKYYKYILATAVILFFINLGMAESVRPQLLTRTFDRAILVKSIGTYNYHVYDLVLNSKTKTQKAFAKSSELVEAENYVKEIQPAVQPDAKPDLFGVAKGKNVILVSLESTQSFVINNTLFGEEITPFLNNLAKESFYFENFYHQTGQGKTSDAEFLIDNSLYPLPRGAVYFTHSQNEYNATPKVLKQSGYYSTVFHANDKTFWNRDLMYQTLGYDRFIAKEDYIITEENSIGWGLKDKEFFEQSIPYLASLPQPFYSKFITLTNHHPFHLGEEDSKLPEYDSNSGTLNRYFATVRYTDEAIEHFFTLLKQAGLYENSIIILYGDHYGISQNHNKAMSNYLDREITPFETVQLQRVPFFIHIPGIEGKLISSVAGQIDVKPTLFHLLGIAGENKLDFGRNLFAENEHPLVVLRDGSFITETHVYTMDTCYQKADGIEVDISYCESHKEQAANDLNYSDKIIYGDLMRFDKQLNRDEPELHFPGSIHEYYQEYIVPNPDVGDEELDEPFGDPQWNSQENPEWDISENEEEKIQRDLHLDLDQHGEMDVQ